MKKFTIPTALALLAKRGAKYDRETNTVDVSHCSQLGYKSQLAITYLQSTGKVKGLLAYQLNVNPHYLLNKMFRAGKIGYDQLIRFRDNVEEFNKQFV